MADAKNPESGGDLILAPDERQDRISEQLNKKKIDCIDQRLTIREEQRRS